MSIFRVNGVYVVIISIDTRKFAEFGKDRLKTIIKAIARIKK